MNIIDALHDPRIFAPLFKDPETWRPWTVFLKALFGLPITDETDLELFRLATGLVDPPTERIRECAAICGRRSGKSFMTALVAVFLACFKDWTPYLNRGETGQAFIIAVDRAQAKIIKNYCSGILNASPVLRRMVKTDLAEAVELKNGITIAIKTSSFRSVRGFSCVFACLEECAFFRSDEFANPDREIATALKPSLATVPESLLMMISTPYARRGLLYDTFKKNYGEPGRTLVWKAPTLIMNPTIDDTVVADALDADAQAASAEWNCEWRQDLTTFLPFDSLEACTVPGRTELPPIWNVEYKGFIDPSFGGQDSFALAIAHAESGGRVKILDVLREARPGKAFHWEGVVQEFALLLRAYRITHVWSDRFSRAEVRNAFRAQGIETTFSRKSTSENYLDLMPLITARSVEILDNRRLLGQLADLDRRVRTGGNDLVIHRPGGHDDLAAAAAGAIVNAGRLGGAMITAL